MSTVIVCEQALLPNYLLIGNSFSYSSQPFHFARINENFQSSILSEGDDRPKSIRLIRLSTVEFPKSQMSDCPYPINALSRTIPICFFKIFLQ